MGIIRVLPEHEIHKIAAGQVVERPASVVKELLENALDAGATAITITIRNGGKTFIRVVDNGYGMDHDDAHACLQNHATSKISSVADLEQITTFGFRGEALASIAAISHLTLKTRKEESKTGLQLTIDGGTITSEQVVSCPIGTDITVANIFFNTPGRQKFLKKDETEWRAIQQLVTTTALQHHTCSFTLTHNEHQILHTPAVATSLERMTQLLGSQMSNDLLTCTSRYEALDLTINGILARAMHHRYDKSQIYVFVNRRPVKNHKLISALIKGYNNILPIGKNPIAALFITIAPGEIDVNIHPRKEEVRFTHPITIERSIQEMVEKALNDDLKRTISPTTIATNFTPARPWQPGGTSAPFLHHSSPSTMRQMDRHVSTTSYPQQSNTEPQEALQQEQICFIQHIGPTEGRQMDEELSKAQENFHYQLLGQMLNTYIIIEIDDCMLIIDQHAAHERVLYELFCNRFNEKASTSLIFPLLITLSNDETPLLNEHLSAFRDYGIDIEQFGSNTFTIRAVPVYLKNAPFDEIIKTFLNWIDEERPVTADDFARLLNDKLRALMACKAAIKAGDRLTTAEMHELLAKLLACEQKTTCPHGRPTTYRLAKRDIEKLFQRCS